VKVFADTGQRLMSVAWPAFMAACVLELLVFAFADPLDMHWRGVPLGWSRQAVYTVGFFIFWGVSFAACAFTMLLRMTPAEINECPFTPGQRPDGCPGRQDSVHS
jgi:hypothetical protein